MLWYFGSKQKSPHLKPWDNDLQHSQLAAVSVYVKLKPCVRDVPQFSMHGCAALTSVSCAHYPCYRWRNVEFVVKRVKAAKDNFILGEVDDVMQVRGPWHQTVILSASASGITCNTGIMYYRHMPVRYLQAVFVRLCCSNKLSISFDAVLNAYMRCCLCPGAGGLQDHRQHDHVIQIRWRHQVSTGPGCLAQHTSQRHRAHEACFQKHTPRLVDRSVKTSEKFCLQHCQRGLESGQPTICLCKQLRLSMLRVPCCPPYCRSEVDHMDRQLQLFSATLDSWLLVQRGWLKLEAVFAAPDIQRQVPAEAAAFAQVDKTFKDIMRRTHDRPNALQVSWGGAQYWRTAGLYAVLEMACCALQRADDVPPSGFWDMTGSTWVWSGACFAVQHIAAFCTGLL